MDEKKILIVDDDEVFLKMLNKTLTSSGYSVSMATNGKDAIDAARDWRPHLIILDIMMPEMDGGEAALVLEKDPTTKNIPIIFMTSLLKKEDENKLTYSPKRSYMAKPYNKDELLAEITKKI
jgi:two-component system sensor histidine kinase/response regulator